MQREELEFLRQSNYIEGEYSKEALDDAMWAWNYLRDMDIEIRYEPETFLYAHYFMMHRIDPSIAGKYRDMDIEIGGNLKPFISKDLIEKDLTFIISLIGNNIAHDKRKSDLTKGMIAKTMHVRFEYLHPFNDGNGRIGRMLFNSHRLDLNLPLMIINESEKSEYYKWF